ncbi:leucine-rich repeat serine/threonine-protein kinase 2-like [Lingula anatina]|uniref:Leucine-rich repeat serine/threonine-protein kinase 2-like n=1 Tax=Lingula anatina TaxID=7574 RepID=A0A1S3JRC0_LINAN|nr:leucine-rich repeat serine/threonine-protein kinase 2-like [Lingula anatina]|eukprot:XP_013412529.1 leucine-rich repeat serine/threonine-protein kinase 2-like [Lingula anatina]
MSENKAQKWNRSFFSSLTTARVRKWRSKPRSKSDATTLDGLEEKGSRKIQKNNTKNGKVISNSNPEVQKFSISVEEFQIENNLNTRAFRSNSCCSKTSHEDESMPSESESERQVSPVLPVKKEEKCQALAAELEACTKPSSVSLLNMLRDLSSVIKYNECITVLEEICERCSFVGAIVEQMKRLPKHVDVQKCGCNLLCDLAFASGKLKQQIQTTDCALHVLYLLDIHAENGSIQAAALKTIGVLAQSAPVRQLLLERDKDLLGKLLVALSSFQNQPDVPARACYALRMILDTDKETYDSLMNGEEYRLVIDALKKNPHSVPVVLEACNMMRDLMKLGSPLLLHHQEPDLASLICKCLKEHVENKEVFVACLGVLEKLSMNADVQQQLLEEELHVFVLNGLMKNPEDVNLQAFGLGVLANMAASVLNFELPQSLDEEMWLKQVYIAMREHFGEPSVQEVACQLLSQLLEHCPDLIDKIGEDSEKNQDPIHAHCLGVILMHGRDADVFIAACNAIYWLAADNTRLRTFLTDRNAYIAILHGMKLHKKLPKAQEYACKAIRGLCIFSEDNKKLMMHQGTLNYLIRALTIFPTEVGVQIEATAAIACLADVEIMRNEQVLKKVHRRVLSAMKTHRTSDNLQEVGMEALSIFAAAAGGVQLLNDIEALTQIVDAMSRFKDSFVIQKKGLMLIQLLAEGATIAKDQEKVLAKVIMNAMRNFEDSLTVQAEGCVAIQVLAENKEEFSDVLVEIGAHECLFDILEEFDERPQYLLDLASECLYVLSCVRDLKSRMLLTACMKGMLQSVECLVELGADVNIGSGHRTPLCYAVLRGHENLVKFLLKQGATDLPRALRLSLEQEDNDSITGILLKYIGHNKQSGLGSFSGLNLGALKPSWLFPTLTGTTFVAPVSEELDTIQLP